MLRGYYRGMGGSARVALVAAVAAALCMPASAGAAYPGSNGKIAFVRDSQIWTMNADSTGETQLTSAAEPSTEPEWSPDGTKILFTRRVICGTNCSSREVRVMNADGTGDTHVYGGPTEADAYSPTWSPDASTIAFVRVGSAGRPCICTTWNIDIANPDGSNRHTIETSSDPNHLEDLEWSPRGDGIAFTGDQPDYGYKIANIKPLPSGYPRNPIPYVQGEIQSVPTWSPDATKLAYLNDTYPASETEIWSVNPDDSTGATQLTDDEVQEFGEEWSPQGDRIVYSGEDPGCSVACNADLYLMNPDGTGAVQLTNTPASETNPDWQPVIGAPRPPGYPHPKGATPLRVPLVPAYRACTTPNRMHGAPLSFPSCSPPAETAPNATTGTPDANGAPAKMIGSLLLNAVAGNSATAANEADVKVSFHVQDVRCHITVVQGNQCASANDSGGTDYTGRVDIRLAMRLTDRYNLPAPAGDSPATGDTTVSFVTYCTATSETDIGGDCSLTTSFDAWYPGAVKEGRRAIMGLDQVEVIDGGSDISGAPPAPFLRQGIFVP
jgi:WD40-like Beta Propeller Repeat